ncbi:MAG: UDP-galactopyranose mutase, partial [uncultured Sphingomonadaceae bacterium]
VRLARRRRRLRRQCLGGAAGEPARRTGHGHRPPAPHRRQRLRPPGRGRRADAPLRPAHLPHQLEAGLRPPVALHAMAPLRAPGAGGGGEPAHRRGGARA